jgi:hypothetical protein
VDSFTNEVLKILERRLAELHVIGEPLSPGELNARFGRHPVSEPAIHFEIDLDASEWALTVTVLEARDVADHGPIRAVSEEVGRLRAAGHLVAYQQVMVAPRGTILVDLVAPPGQTAADARLEASAQIWLEALFDHRTVRPLLK